MMPLDGVMKYDQIKEFSDEEFRRLTGVKRSTFEKMVAILTAADQEKKARGGRKSKLSIENRILMALEYIREYRTYFHVAAIREPLFIDVVVEDKVLVEVKATEKNHPIYETQVLTYLRLTGIKLGLLVNFGAPYVKDGVSRIINGIL
jgi:GxxExxY protein